MPENFYCLDNFFKKMTDIESPRKNNDCYFYYYSTCAKGDNCTFRHEPSALGCETMCSFWKEGKCLNVHCNFRHMELRKNRKAIACYWEAQPGGCLKPHCPFQHQSGKSNPDESIDSKTDSGTESADNTMNEKLNLSDKSFQKAPVDALVVNFEEESDNESAPTNSPVKATRLVKVKTLEEIKLEKIQAEQAAYYSYPEHHKQDSDDLRKRILDRLSTRTKREPVKRFLDPAAILEGPQSKRPKEDKDINEIKIKTLKEIRAERMKKSDESDHLAICDNSVTSTEDLLQEEGIAIKPKSTRIKLHRNLPSLKDITKEDSSEERQFSDSEDVNMLETTVGNKTIDEVLLLQDEDDNSNVSLKDEERLLNDMDDDLLL